MLAIGEDVAHLRELERPHLALYVGGMGARGRNFYNDLVRQYGYEREAALIQDMYLAGRRAEAAAASMNIHCTSSSRPPWWVMANTSRGWPATSATNMVAATIAAAPTT